MPDKVFMLFQLRGKAKFFRGVFSTAELADKEAKKFADSSPSTTRFKIVEAVVNEPVFN